MTKTDAEALNDVRQWNYYPMPIPLNAKGEGPVNIAEAVEIKYEVWDQQYLSHSGYDNLPDAINASMKLNIALAAEKRAAGPVELRNVAEQLTEKSGFWRHCTGCLEMNEGHPVGHYPYSEVFKCQIGSGCSECGGIGAVWDNTDYEELAKAMEPEAAVPVDAERERAAKNCELQAQFLRLNNKPLLAAELMHAATLLRTPAEASDDAMLDGFYLASFKRKAWDGCVTWWRADNKGYTTDIDRAGIYTLIEKGYHDSEYTVPVPVSFIASARVRRSIDPGDETNKAFRTAEDLRAALLAARQGEKK